VGPLGRRVTLAALVCLVLGLTGAQSAPLATFVVTTTADSGVGSLRQAILDANATVGVDTITFAIPGAGDRVIQPTSDFPLPTVTDAVVIDGSAHLDGSGLPLVRIDGALAGAVNGLSFSAPAAAGTSGVFELAFTRWSGFGLSISGTGAVLVQGSIFGTNAASALGLTNGAGINVGNGSTIGGTAASSRNYVVGGATGIATQTGAIVQGNWIGLAPDGETTIGASIQGLRVEGAAAVIGGFAPGSGNVITGNAVGVRVQGSASGNLIQENSIYDNGGLGIDLNPPGVTPNDPPANLDADTGPNGLQNFPVLTAATSTTVSGELDSGPSQSYTIDVYASPACDPSGNGEGETHVASILVTTNGSGHATFTDHPLSTTVSGVLTATATAAANNDTSEFSTCHAIGGGGTPQPGPTFTVNDNNDVQPFADVGCTTDECTLREAIVAANTQPGANTIAFDITGDTQIAVSGSPLPAITGQLHIDGITQPVGTVTIDGDGAGASNGLVLAAGSSGSVIERIQIEEFASDGEAGIVIQSSANTVLSNRFQAVSRGVVIAGAGATDNTIGGNSGEGEGNLIWDFSGIGVNLDQAGNGNKVQGNTIGLDPSDVPSGGPTGIRVFETPGAVIGAEADPDEGSDEALRSFGNVVVDAKNGEGNYGIIVSGASTTGTIVAFNSVGTDRAGDATTLGNDGPGIFVAGSSNNQLGPANRIAYNSGSGIDVADGTGNRIVANSIHDNAGEGISLANANDDVSLPDLDDATISGSTTIVTGTVSSGTTQTVHIEFFANADCDGSFGEGETFLGFATVSLADNTVPFEFDTNLVSAGDVITATTTDVTSESTSEFSNCVTVEAGGGSGGTLTGGRTAASGTIDLTAEGTADWAVWGFSTGGEQCTTDGDCSTTLAPDVRKIGGAGISDLVNINPGTPIPLRGIGFVPTHPFTFAWSGGAPTPTETNARVGLQHNGDEPTNLSTLGTGFGFSVPADTTPRTLKVWVAQNRAGGQFTATLSDGSAPAFSNSFDVGVGDFVGSLYTLTYSAASVGQTLDVTWVENVDNCVEFRCDNVSIHAVALQGPGGGGDADPPTLFAAVPDANGPVLGMAGLAEGEGLPAGTSFELQFYSSTSCGNSEPPPLGVPRTVTTNENGVAAFALEVTPNVAEGTALRATARFPGGAESELSNCVIADRNNTSWPTALQIPANGGETGHLRASGEARWFKVPIVPNSRVDLTLSDLPGDYDMVVFSDIQAAYDRLVGTDYDPELGPNLALDDLKRQGAEEPVDNFNTSQFNTSSWDPTNWDPTLNSAVFSPSQWSPSQWSPSQWSASMWAPSQWSPSQWSPSQWSPSQWSPSQWSPSQWSPSQWSPSQWSSSNPADPKAFSSAQTASVLAVSGGTGTGTETVSVNTWNNTGFFYVRVQGKNGAFDPEEDFSLDAERGASPCGGVVDQASSPGAPAGTRKTVVLYDASRMTLGAGLTAKLSTFAGRPEVNGALVNVASDPVVSALNAQADLHRGCPYAKNLVAAAITRIVDAYRENNPVEYVVVVGGDDVIPFYRYPDPALLGNENLYVPPVVDTSASQASLRLSYILNQDGYGSSDSISLHGSQFPVPDLAVGRLVETPAEIEGMLDAYLGTTGGVVPTPTSSLTTGYDFLEDAARTVSGHLSAGIGGSNNDLLMTLQTVSPGDSTGNLPDRAWTASELRTQLFNSGRNDLVFLAGHFSANDALAADYRTNILSTEVPTAAANMENSIIFSAGCHTGYNIVNGDATQWTQPLDWAQAFARKKATLISGTGYQYGDTDFLAHSERIYAEFARQLRVTTQPGGAREPVAIGHALLRSKQVFLEDTPGLTALDEKALLQTTLFGLPMLSVNMPQGRIVEAPEGTVVPPLTDVGPGPGADLGLKFANLGVGASLTPGQKQLKDGPLATWLSGPDGVAVRPTQPILPLETLDVSSPAPGLALRGVGFRSGAYTDTPNVTPLTAAPATELRGIHAPFFTDVFFPTRPWTTSFFGELGNAPGGTQLHVTPVQHRSSSPTMTRRAFSSLGLQLFYSGNLSSYCPGTSPLQLAPCPDSVAVAPALAAPPTITGVETSYDDAADELTFSVHVVGDVVAGIQDVWVTWTIPPPCSGAGCQTWQSIDLVQDEDDPTLWAGTLSTATPGAVNFVVQAVNGVGRVTLDDNVGAFYRPGAVPGQPGADPPATTTLAFTDAPPSTVRYGEEFDVAVQLAAAAGCPVGGKQVRVGIAGGGLPATTNGSGVTPAIALRALLAPGTYLVTASFAGTANCTASDVSVPIQVVRQSTSLALAFPVVTLTATTTPPTPLPDRAVTVRVSQGAVLKFEHVGRTDPQGRMQVPASLLAGLAQGSHTVVAEYAGEIGYAGSTVSGSTLNVIRRGAGNDSITGTNGDDLIIDAGGNNAIDARGGNDTILVSGSGSNSVNGGTGNDQITTGSGNDSIQGGDGDDTIDAGNGNNAVNAGAGHDRVTTGTGNDSVQGGDGNDSISVGNGNNSVNAGSGNDVIAAGSGNDAIDGGPGFDLCDPGGGTNSVRNCEG
jgi:parallel beta-helix repeat protein